jgi:type III secretion system YscQ/HrcQ family protein
MLTQPYPFDRLPKFTRHQLRVLAGLGAFYDEQGRAEALRSASALLGANVSLTVGVAEARHASSAVARLAALGPCVAMLLECRGGPLEACVAVELSGAFAERLVDRILGGEDIPVLPPTLLSADPLACGALAYLAARILAALSGGLRLRHVTADLNQFAMALGEGALLICPFEVQVGNDAGSARLYVPETLLLQARAPSLRDLPSVPLTLIAELGRAALRCAQLSELRPGDIVVLDACSLAFDGLAFAGQVLVHVAGSRSHLVCNVRDRSLEVESVTSVKEPKMTAGRLSQPPEPNSAAPNLAADAPLELSVELARFSLTLGELQRTQPGDVLITGRRIGEAVTLRVAGRAIAQGELVDVEGEIGVRITQFLHDSA